MRVLVIIGLLSAGIAAAGAGEPIRPRGLLPRIAAAPVGGPERQGDKVRLGMAVLCSGRPMAGVRVGVFADRANKRKLWNGVTDADGQAHPLVPAATGGGVVCVTLTKAGYSSPVFVRLIWDAKAQTSSVTQDSTAWVSTAKLGKWELASGDGAHVYFDWSHRRFAGELIEMLAAQRRAIGALLGVALEPMGAIVVSGKADEARYITRKGNHTVRTGVFIHGVRSWPIVATSMAQLAKTHSELHELHLVLAHELTENSVFGPAFVGIEHKTTRWFRDGLAELVQVTVVPARHADLAARHLGDRINHLSQGIAAGEKTVNLLAWTQQGKAPVLPRYAAAMAVMDHVVAKIGWKGVAKVLAAASGRMKTDSRDLQALLAEAGAKEIMATLTRVDLGKCVKVLEARKKNMAAGKR